MSEPTTAPQTPRRRLSFQTADDVVTEVNRLRRMPLKPRAKWNLPQACHHIAATIEGGLTPPDTIVPTPEESAQREAFFKVLLSPEGIPEGLPTNPATSPPEACDEAAVDRMIAAFDTLSKYPHTHVKVAGCGPVPIDDVVKLHLLHAAHHLSFQEPVTPPRAGLQFASIEALIADIETLRRGYTQAGGWSLPRMSFHLSRALPALDVPVTRIEPTEEEKQAQAFFQYLVGGGKIPSGRPVPPGSEPPVDAGDAQVDELLAGLRKLAGTPQPFVHFGRFGPVKSDDFKRFIAAHCAHHLAYLEPVKMG